MARVRARMRERSSADAHCDADFAHRKPEFAISSWVMLDNVAERAALRCVSPNGKGFLFQHAGRRGNQTGRLPPFFQRTARALDWTGRRHERFGGRRTQSMRRVLHCVQCVVATRRQCMAGQLR